MKRDEAEGKPESEGERQTGTREIINGSAGWLVHHLNQKKHAPNLSLPSLSAHPWMRCRADGSILQGIGGTLVREEGTFMALRRYLALLGAASFFFFFLPPLASLASGACALITGWKGGPNPLCARPLIGCAACQSAGFPCFACGARQTLAGTQKPHPKIKVPCHGQTVWQLRGWRCITRNSYRPTDCTF